MAGEEHTAKERPTCCSQIDGDGGGGSPTKKDSPISAH